MVEVIAISNRCELDSLENLFSRESLKLGRIEIKSSLLYSYYLYHENIPMLQYLTDNLIFHSCIHYTISATIKNVPSLEIFMYKLHKRPRANEEP